MNENNPFHIIKTEANLQFMETSEPFLVSVGTMVKRSTRPIIAVLVISVSPFFTPLPAGDTIARPVGKKPLDSRTYITVTCEGGNHGGNSQSGPEADVEYNAGTWDFIAQTSGDSVMVRPVCSQVEIKLHELKMPSPQALEEEKSFKPVFAGAGFLVKN